MKFEKEIDQMLHDLLFEAWMSDVDYKEIIDKTFEITGISKQQLNDELIEGEKNGYPIDIQIKVLKRILKNESN